MLPKTDSVPRTTLLDLFTTLRVVAKDSPTTLETIRQHFCVERQRRTAGDLLWSTAAYNVQELNRLGLLEAEAIPKNKRNYEQLKLRKVAATEKGLKLSSVFGENRAGAYDELFKLMYAAHPYLRAFVQVLNENYVFAPVVTSLKDHVSPKYSSALSLVEDILGKSVDVDSFYRLLEQRLKRSLTTNERGELAAGLKALVDEVGLAATSEDPTEFSKKFLLKINDCILPILLKKEGLSFDYRTHRTLWSFGQEWKLWQSTSDHPEHDGRLIYRTATIRLTSSGNRIDRLCFDSGLAKTRENFLDKLYHAYTKVQRMTKSTFSLAWQLRAVFCFDNRCQESVFDRLMEEHYMGSDEYELTLEIQRQRGQYDRPLRVANRNIGLIRVVKK